MHAQRDQQHFPSGVYGSHDQWERADHHGGSAEAHGSTTLFSLASSSLTVNDTTLEYATYSITGTGSVTLNRGTVRGHTVSGITIFGDLTINDSTVSFNTVDGAHANGTIDVTDSTFMFNATNGISSGGAINVSGSDIEGNGTGISSINAVSVSDSSIDHNINGISSLMAVTLTNSSVPENESLGILGAVSTGDVTLTNSTLTENGDGGLEAYQNATITSSTITGNGEFGIKVRLRSTLTATLLADNGSTNCSSAVSQDNGSNLSDDASCQFSLDSSRNAVLASDLALGTPGVNAGPTLIVPLLPGSIAIDAVPASTLNGNPVFINGNGAAIVDPITSNPLRTDQRGYSRPQGATCDIGAYEILTTTTSSTSVSAAATDGNVTLTASIVDDCVLALADCPGVNQGTITFTLTGTQNPPVVRTLTPGSYTFTATYADAGLTALFTGSQWAGTLTIVPGPAAQITLSPGNSSASLGSSISEVVTVTDAIGNPAADGTALTFSVSGVNPTTGTVSTLNGPASILLQSGDVPGNDSLTVSPDGDSTPNAGAVISWTPPDSTSRASLTIISPLASQITALAQTGRRGSTPAGSFSYNSPAVRLGQVHLTSLVARGVRAALYGSAQLGSGTPVTFVLDVTQGGMRGSVRLRLSNGYDSGRQAVAAVRIRP